MSWLIWCFLSEHTNIKAQILQLNSSERHIAWLVFFVSFWAGLLKCQILFFNYFLNSSKFWHILTTPRSLAREEPDVCQSAPGPFPSTRESAGAYQEGDVVSGDGLGILCTQPLDRETGTLITLCASWRCWELLEVHLEWRSGSLKRWGQATPRFGNALPSPVPALVISLEVDTQLSEKEDEVIPVGFRLCTWRCRTLRGRMEVD